MAKKKTSKKSVNTTWGDRYKRSEGVLFRKQKDEVLVILLDDPDTFYRIDAWAMELWNKLDGKTSIEKICEKIHVASKLPLPFVQKESLKILRQMKDANLVIKI